MKSNNINRIKNCRVCGSSHIYEFFDIGEQPLANSLLDDLTKPEEKYPLSLSFCRDCRLVQLNHTVNPKILFSSYVWVTGTSSTARKHAEDFYTQTMARLSDGSLKGSYVLEVASNDGTFLLPFIEKGHKVLGVDPAKNVVDMAFKDGIPTLCKFFGRAVAKDIFKEHGKAKVVFARNVIPHVANLHDVIDGMADCLSDDGIMVIEAHYAKKILEETHYDSIYHEHLCYFTLFSMEKLLNLHGLRVFDIWGSPISGGSMVLFIDKGAHKETPIVTEYRVAERKIKLNEFASWKEFANKAAIHKERLVQMIKDETTRTGRPVLGYGASARSSTLLNYCGIGHYLIPIIADKNPLKQGKYTAGTHIPITTVEQFMSWIPGCICILAWNFADEIKRELYNDYGYTGSFILPLPNDPRLERGD